MMPRSHFLFGMFVGAVVSIFFTDFTLGYVFLAGIAAVLVDIDHFVSHMLAEKEFSLTGMWKRVFNDHYKKHLKAAHYRSKYVHKWQGFLIFSVLLAPIAFWMPILAVALYAGYYSHLLADWLSGLNFYGHMRPYVLEVQHLMYPVVVDELIFDVFVFDLAMIILLYRGLI